MDARTMKILDTLKREARHKRNEKDFDTEMDLNEAVYLINDLSAKLRNCQSELLKRLEVMKKCDQCGLDVHSDFKHCPRCGEEIK